MMFTLGVFALVVALVAAALGLGGVLVGTAITIAKILFVVGIVVFVISYFTGRKNLP